MKGLLVLERFLAKHKHLCSLRYAQGLLDQILEVGDCMIQIDMEAELLLICKCFDKYLVALLHLFSLIYHLAGLLALLYFFRGEWVGCFA